MCATKVSIYSSAAATVSSLVATYSGSTVPQTLTVNSHVVLIHFVSDSSVADSGWTVTYSAGYTGALFSAWRSVGVLECFVQIDKKRLTSFVFVCTVYRLFWSRNDAHVTEWNNHRRVGLTQLQQQHEVLLPCATHDCRVQHYILIQRFEHGIRIRFCMLFLLVRISTLTGPFV